MFALKVFIILVLLTGFSVGILGLAKNYCKRNRCNEQHISCSYPHNISSICRPRSFVINMSRYKNLLLRKFNTLRNNSAGAQINDFAMAARMAKMVWSDELQYFAEADVMLCRTTTKRCLSSLDFYYIEHFIELFSYSGPESTFTNYDIMHRLIEEWFLGIKDIFLDIIIYMPEKLRNNRAAMAALLISERNTHVGCAALRNTYDYFHHFFFSCAFSTMNFIHMPIYKLSSRAGNKCHKGRDKTFVNLCAVGEEYDNDKNIPRNLIEVV